LPNKHTRRKVQGNNGSLRLALPRDLAKKAEIFLGTEIEFKLEPVETPFGKDYEIRIRRLMKDEDELLNDI
jgi:hypothetical protein